MPTSKLYMIIGLVVFLLFPTATDAEEKTSDTFSIGVVPVSDATAVNNIAELISAELTGQQHIQLVERQALNKIRREKSLTAALSSPQNRLQLGKTLGADFLVFINGKEQQKLKEVHLQAVDCKTGAIVYATDLPLPEKQDVEALLRKVSDTLRQKMKWMSKVSRDELVPVSIPTINCLAPDAVSDQQLARRVRHRLRTRLGSRPEIICLERQEIKKAKREIEAFKGGAADFWNSSVIVTGTAGLQGRAPGNIFVSLQLRIGSSRMKQPVKVTGNTRQFDRLIKDLCRKITDKTLPPADRQTQISLYHTQQEVERLSRLVKIYHSKSQFRKAQRLFETVLAFQKQPPTKEQCHRMALILQNMLQPMNLSHPPPEQPDEYFKIAERYILMLEHFVKPRYEFVYRDIARFITQPPASVAKLLNQADKKSQKDSVKAPTRLRLRRLKYLRQLWRAHNEDWKKIGARNSVLTYSDNPDEIVVKYRQHWEAVVEQLANPLEPKGSVTLRLPKNYRKTFQHEKVKKPISEIDQAIRANFLMTFCLQYMRIGIKEGRSAYGYDPAKIRKRLYNIHREVIHELCKRLSLPAEVKALLIVRFSTGYPGEKYFRPGIIATPREKFFDAVKRLGALLRKNVDAENKPWIIEFLLHKSSSSPNRKYAKVANVFWLALYSLPPTKQHKLFKDGFKPLLKAHPKSVLAASRVSLHWFQRRLHLDRSPLSVPQQEILAELIHYYENRKGKRRRVWNKRKITKFLREKAKSRNPDLLKKIKAIQSNKSSKGANKLSQNKVSWPTLSPADFQNCSEDINFQECNMPLSWTVHGNLLWILWAGDKYVVTALDLEKFKIQKAFPVSLEAYRRNRHGSTYIRRPSRVVQFCPGSWAFSEKHLFIGVRLRRLEPRNKNSIRRFLTVALPIENPAGKSSKGQPLSGLVKEAVPEDGPLGIPPQPKRASKHITAFCSYENVVYLADSEGFYAWNEENNKLKLLASNQIENDRSPLNGGLGYDVYWMGADAARERILFAIHEWKGGSASKSDREAGPRTGIWAYTPGTGEYKQLIKTKLGNFNLPFGLYMRIKDDEVAFNSLFLSGKLNLKELTIRVRGAESMISSNNDNGEPEPIKPLKNLVDGHNSSSQLARIAHPWENAWITYAKMGENERLVYWMNDEKILQKLQFNGVHSLKEKIRISPKHPAFKIIPVPGGALVWHLCKISEKKYMPALLYWKVDPQKDGKDVIYNFKQEWPEIAPPEKQEK